MTQHQSPPVSISQHQVVEFDSLDELGELYELGELDEIGELGDLDDSCDINCIDTV